MAQWGRAQPLLFLQKTNHPRWLARYREVPRCSSGLCGHSHMCGIHSHRCAHIHVSKNKGKKNLETAVSKPKDLT